MERGDIIIALLREPREQIWGALLRLDQAGLEIRGLDPRIFDEWARQLAGNKEMELGPSTLFFPSHRIEKISLDEQVGSVPSMSAQFENIVGKHPKEFFIKK